MPSTFDRTVVGPPPGGDTVTTLLWVDLGVLPTGFKFRAGAIKFLIPKTTTVALRTNNVGQSAGTDGTTTQMWATSFTAKSTSVIDLYKNGRLVIATKIGTGVEHWWLKITSKSTAAVAYNYMLSYREE